MTIVMNELRLPSDVEERILKARQERDTAENARVQSALKTLQERYRSERLKLISADTEQKLQEYSAANRPSPIARLNFTERSRSRTAALASARGLGVDLAALARLHADTHQQFESIVNPPQLGYGEVVESPSSRPLRPRCRRSRSGRRGRGHGTKVPGGQPPTPAAPPGLTKVTGNRIAGAVATSGSTAAHRTMTTPRRSRTAAA